MKKYLFVALCMLMLLVLVGARSQNLTARTNSLALDFSNGSLPESESLPVIEWIYPRDDYSHTESSNIEISVEITSSTPIASISLTIGEDESKKKLGTKIFPIDSGAVNHKLNTKVWIPEGSSYLDLKVTDINGAIVSEKRSVVVGKHGFENILSMDRKDYALLFATDRYDEWDDLVNPIDDAHSIARELKDNYGFEVEIVENPTMEEVWEKLRNYSHKTFNPQDQLMIFFAGHGHFDESFGEGYVVATNSLAKDVSKTTYISHNRLRAVIDNIPSKHILLSMDVCFGGTFDPILARARALEDYSVTADEMVIRKLSKKTRKYLTSGGKEYVSDGIPGHHSPFAAKMLEALRSKGGSDRILTLAEMKANLENLALVPRFGSFGTDEALSDFVFIAR